MCTPFPMATLPTVAIFGGHNQHRQHPSLSVFRLFWRLSICTLQTTHQTERCEANENSHFLFLWGEINSLLGWTQMHLQRRKTGIWQEDPKCTRGSVRSTEFAQHLQKYTLSMLARMRCKKYPLRNALSCTSSTLYEYTQWIRVAQSCHAWTSFNDLRDSLQCLGYDNYLATNRNWPRI